MLRNIKPANWWWISNVLSCVLFILLFLQWMMFRNDYSPVGTHSHPGNFDNPSLNDGKVYIPTGLFIQSIHFENASDVNVTGYVWQRYHKQAHLGIEKGFVFPESVNSGSNLSSQQAFQVDQDGEEIIGWYFESTLRQKFDYSKYPLDHKNVWIRIWHKDFLNHKISLIPDKKSFPELLSGISFGIDEDIVLSGWDIRETFFEHETKTFPINFADAVENDGHSISQLKYTIVIDRQLVNAFVTDGIPVFVCAILLFTTLLTVTNNSREISYFGFNVMGIVAACSALFFVIIVAHGQLRRHFPGNEVVYLELYYVLMYVLIAAVVANTYIFTLNRSFRLIRYGDNLFPKIAYWPTTLAAANLFTWYTF